MEGLRIELNMSGGLYVMGERESSLTGVYVVTNCTVSRTEEALVKVRDMTKGVTMEDRKSVV